MADDKLRKGQRGAVGCVDLLIYRSLEEEEALTTSRLIIQVLFSSSWLRFHHLCSSSVTQLACMMSADGKSYDVMSRSGSRCES